MAAGASSEEYDGLFGGFSHARDCIAIAPVVEFRGIRRRLPSEAVVSEHVRKRRSRYFELGKFGKDALERNARFERQRLRIGRTEAGENLAYGRPFDGSVPYEPFVRSGFASGYVGGSKFGKASGKFAKHVIRVRNAFGRSVADERIRAETPGTQNVSRNREHLFSEIEGELRRNEASRFFRRLGYERAVGKTRHQSVADGKMVRHRSDAWSESGDDGPARFHYRIEKRAVRLGIVDVDTGSDERDGNATGFDRREMGGRIDSRRSSGNGRDAARTEGRNEPFGHFLAVGRGFSRSDDRNGNLGSWQRSTDVE